MSEQREVVIDLDDPLKNGVYKTFDSISRGAIGAFVEQDSQAVKMRLVRKSEKDRPWDDVNTQDCALQLSLGEPNSAPDDGTMTWSYNLDTTNLVELPHDITAAALQALINARADFAGANAVTVTKHGNLSFTIRWNSTGARSLFDVDVADLVPDCTVQVLRVTAGTVTRHEVQTVKIKRAPYALLETFTSVANDAIVIQQRQIGTATKKSVQRIHFDKDVETYDGNLIINFEKPEIVRIACEKNVGKAEVYQIQIVADVAGAQNLTYDDYTDALGVVVRVYLFNGAGAPPPNPGRLIVVNFVNNDTANTIAAAYAVAVNADAQLNAVAGGAGVPLSKVTVTQATAGAVAALPVAVSTGHGVVRTVIGDNGPLWQKTVKLYDKDGSVGVWWGLAGELPPNAATDCDRQIQVTLTTNMTAAANASATQTAVNADLEFNAIVVAGTNTVEITDATGGVRETPAADVDSGQGVRVKQEGKSLTANVEFDAPANEIEKELGGYFEVIRRKGGDIDLKANQVGPQPAITVDGTGLSFPNVLEGDFVLNTYSMYRRFLLEPEKLYITLILQFRIAFPGKQAYTFLYAEVKVFRTVLDEETLQPVPVGSFTGVNFRYKNGTTLQLKNRTTNLFHTIWMEGIVGVEHLAWDAGEA